MSVDSKYGMQVRQNKWAEKGLLKFGYNSAVSTDDETIWDGGGIYSYPSSASTMSVSSDDDTDTSVVTISGLDDNYDRATETVTITGQTAVTTSTSFVRVNRVTVDSGEPSGAIYIGTGTVTSGVPANIFAKVQTGENQTLMAVWTVPAGFTAYLQVLTVSCGTSVSNKYTEARLKVRPFGGVFQTKAHLTLQNAHVQQNFDYPVVITEKSDIEVRALTSSGTDSVSATFSLVYVKN